MYIIIMCWVRGLQYRKIRLDDIQNNIHSGRKLSIIIMRKKLSGQGACRYQIFAYYMEKRGKSVKNKKMCDASGLKEGEGRNILSCMEISYNLV